MLLHNQARDGADLADQCGHAMTQTAGYQFFQEVLPVCNALPASHACERFGASPSWLMSDQQVRLSGRKRECQPLDRAVAGDLQDLLSEPSPLPQMKAHVATATHTVH